MAEKEFTELLKQMGEIAKAVNAFTSEAIQRDAFATLVAALSDGRSPPDLKGSTEPLATRTKGESTPKPANAKRKTGNKDSGQRSVIKIDKNMNLRPVGKQSFAQFIEEKQPTDNQSKFPTVVYYIEDVLEYPKVSISHIATAFRMTTGWREPSDLAAALRVTAHRKNTINTEDLENITLTAQGRNFVEHDLPEKPRKK